MYAKSLQSCPTLYNPMDCSQTGLSVHGILQGSGLPCPPSGDLPDQGTEPMSLMSSALAGRFFTTVPPGKPISDQQPERTNYQLGGGSSLLWSLEMTHSSSQAQGYSLWWALGLKGPSQAAPSFLTQGTCEKMFVAFIS